MKALFFVSLLVLTAIAPSLFSKPPAAVASPIVVAQTAISGGDQVSPLLGVMNTMHAQMAAMKMTGNTDKDYQHMMHMLAMDMKSATQAEMKSGKNPHEVETAKQVYNRLFNSNPLDGIFGINQ